MIDLKGKVAVVTGASRGVGKGVALALGRYGATVYVTGRSTTQTDSPLGGTITGTAHEVTQLGGLGIPVTVDHSDPDEVKALFEQVAREQGKLDILVNNAISIPDHLTEVAPFWQKPLSLLSLLDVGLRSNYVAAYYAAPLLIESRGLIVNISSFGSVCYMHGPAYGIGKAGTDKMSHDMGHDFNPYGVTVVSLYPGLVKTERTLAVFAKEPEKYGGMVDMAETPEFTGKVIAALYTDPKRQDKTGAVWVGAELAQTYGVTDLDGKTPASHRGFLGNPPQYSEAVVE